MKMFKKKTLIFLSLLTALSSFSQSLKKIAIGNSGCSLYSYCPLKIEMAPSKDSSIIYTGECVSEAVSYGVICVKLLHPRTDLSQAEELMVAYLDYLKASFDITSAAGYGKGHRLNNNENTRGILDYWEDKERNKWKVKAWTDGKFIGVMYVFSKKELPESKVNVFLDSFRLPL